MMRTTCGHASNALPQLAAANVDCRLLPDDSGGTGGSRIDEIDRRRSGKDHHHRKRRPEPGISNAARYH
jgi:acetylornithine deacetylase/succinyl-diaminopimelate desuccinylase-like protein